MVFKNAFPKRTFNNNYLSVTTSALLQLAIQFLAINNIKKNELQLSNYKLGALFQKDQTVLFNKVLIKAQNDNDRKISEENLYHQYLQSQTLAEFAVKNNSRNYYNHLLLSKQALDDFYALTRLKFDIEQLTQQNVFNINQQQGQDETTNYLIEKNTSESPAIIIYKQLYIMLSNSDKDEHYEKFYDTLIKNVSHLNNEDVFATYAYAMNYCVRKVNEGKQHFQIELLKLYKFALQNDLLLTDGNIHYLNYKNIVSAGLRNNEIDWTEQFIIEYKSKLKKEVRKNAFNYNLANLHFYKSEYGKAQTKLLNIDFTDVYYAMDYRALLLKIYFEQTAFDALDNLLSAFAVFVRRNKKASANMKRLYLNQIKFTKQLSNTSPRNKKRLQLIKERIANTQQVGDRNWLNQKIDEFLT